jgi:hypothetical protein
MVVGMRHAMLSEPEAPRRVRRGRADHGRPAIGAGEPSVFAMATATLALPDKPSIAVLPFNNMSSDPEQELLRGRHQRGHHHRPCALCVAVRDRAQFVLQIQGPCRRREVGRARVRRTPSARGQPAQGRQPERVTAQLIESESGNHVWAERYDRDLFAVQDEITEA